MDPVQFLRRSVPLTALYLVAIAPPAMGEGESTSAQPSSRPDDGKLTVIASLSLPDGSPAAGAILRSKDGEIGSPAEAPADEQGRVQLRGMFGNGAQLHASTPDGQYQAALSIPAGAARTAFHSPIDMQLAPARQQRIVVVSDGRPVEGALVVVAGNGFQVRGVTGPEGAAEIKLPAGQDVVSVTAWHPTLGVAGKRDFNKPPSLTEPLALYSPAPLAFRFLDTNGQPVAKVNFGMNARIDGAGWDLITDGIESPQNVSDERGEAVIDWAPQEKLSYVDVELRSDQWKVDRIDIDALADRLVVVHLRRKTPVEGQIIMPDAASAEGLLVTGFAFGPHHRGDIPAVRARRDGTFTLPVASAHGYIVGICDDEFSSPLYPSVILPADGETPDNLKIEAYPATPLTVRVTRGADRQPAPGAWVNLSSRGQVEYVNGTGEKSTGNAGVQQWLLTDADGEARAGVGRGEIEVRLNADDWNEERKIKVPSTEPVNLEFHRAWQGKRQLAMRLVVDGKPYRPAPNSVALAWSEQPSRMAISHEAVIAEDGALNVAYDADNLAVLVIDREHKLSGYVRFAGDEPPTELRMLPMATYRGAIVQQDGTPLANRTVELQTQASFLEVAEAQQTDDEGRFEFVGVPVQTPLRVDVKNDPGSDEYYIFDNSKAFEPGEVRDKDVLSARRSDELMKPQADLTPLAERLMSACRNSKVTGMPVLAVLSGEDSADANVLVGAVLDGEGAINNYLPLKLAAAQVETDATILEEYGWPKPAGDEVVLIVLDAEQKVIDHARINLAGARAAAEQGGEFLKRHRPMLRDARALLAAAQENARRDDRRVWIILGGPRCGPCFALARWVDQHHAVLEKDYVILKIMGGVDAHSEEVIGQFRDSDGGIPWHAIIEPDGERLVTSDGPLGNIGMPGSVEGLRHFRKMLESTANRMTAQEIDALIKSLSSDD
jgi:hypothetical protein